MDLVKGISQKVAASGQDVLTTQGLLNIFVMVCLGGKVASLGL